MKVSKPAKPNRQQAAPVKSKEPDASSLKRLRVGLGLICALIALLLYVNTLGHDYAVDDGTVIKNNKLTVKGISSIPEIFTSAYRKGFWERKEGVYRPLSVVMFAIEYEIAPDKPFLGHLVNLLLYGFTGWILFQTLCLFFAGRNYIIPFFITLLFIAHPVHTEVVANIKSRDELLCFLFVISTFYFMLRQVRTASVVNVIAGAVCYFLALLSKENALTIMAVFPLLLYFFTSYDLKKTLAAWGVFAGVVAIYMGIRYMALQGLNYDVEILAINNSLVEATSFASRLAGAIMIMGKYLLLLLVPHPLVFDYSYNTIPNVTFADWRPLLSLVVYGALIFYAIKNFTTKNPISFGILFFLITMSLVSNVVILIEAVMGERFLYMPSMGFAIAAGIGLLTLLKTDTARNKAADLSSFFSINKKAMGVLTVILVLFAFKTVSRNMDWKDNLTLLATDVQTSPNSARIRYAYGSALVIEKGLDEKDPAKKEDYLNRGIAELEKGVSILASYSDAWYHLGMAYKEKGDGPNAVRAFERAKQQKAWKDPEFFNSSGLAYNEVKQYDKAIADFKQAIVLDPKLEEAYNNLGLTYCDAGMLDESIKTLNDAIKLNPKTDKPYYNMGNTYAKAGDYNKAIEWYTKAVALNKDYSDAYNNIGNSFAAMKDYTHAIENYKKVIEIDPNNSKVLYNIGVTYHMLGDDKTADEYIARSKAVVR
jgi:tetratricopeptide (TPR) repeat protein